MFRVNMVFFFSSFFYVLAITSAYKINGSIKYINGQEQSREIQIRLCVCIG